MKTSLTNFFDFFATALFLASIGSALAEVHYVDVNGTNATPPYTNWSTAATNIQDAVDAAVAGDEIVVTNGTYHGVVYVDEPLSVRSVNGPQTTTIDGFGERRCVCLADKATLSGFTLQNGYVLNDGYVGGAGVQCESSNAVVSNCVITGNRALGINSGFIYGGGAYGGTLNNCILSNNSVGALLATNLSDSIESYGGGAAACTLNNCTLLRNSSAATNSNFASWASAVNAYGGGAAWCALNSCALRGNSTLAGNIGISQGGDLAFARGGGVAFCTLNNSSVGRNIVSSFGGGCCYFPEFGGAYASGLFNCIVYNNVGGNYDPGSFVSFCCTTPQPTNGSGNITTDPLFMDMANGNLRLQSNSPCINAGNNAFAPAGPDLDGNPRIAGGTVDIGAYEFQSPVSLISYAWLQQFNLPINPSIDSADPDGDGVDIYHEWRAGTDPTNPLSSPAQLTIIPSGANLILTWPTNAIGFTLQSTTNLGSPAAWATNCPAPVVIGGQNTVTNPIAGAQQFYRLVQ